MRLLSLTVRNYRVHQERTLEFDPALTLVGGPNEAGKSTLVEAAHRALFLRATTGGGVRDEMVSRIHGGHPEVELHFEVGGAHWSVRKRFAGSSGTILLSSPGRTSLTGDEAEARLSELLGGEAALGGRQAGRLGGKWGHLWVWQGTSGVDPSEGIAEQSNQLIRRLQSMGGLGLVLSDRDARVAGEVDRRFGDIFTPTGRPSAGSPLVRAEKEVEDAEELVLARREMVRELERAMREFEEAGELMNDATGRIEALRGEGRELAERKARIEELERGMEEARRRLAGVEERLTQHEERENRIEVLSGETAAIERRLEPRRRRRAMVAAKRTELEAAALAARSERDEAVAAARDVRRERERSRARLAVARLSAELEGAVAAEESADEQRERLDVLAGELAELPTVSEERLEHFRTLDTARGEAAARLEALATGVEVVTSELPVAVDGEALAPGSGRTVTDPVELQVGEGTRIRIRPGGGEGPGRARELLAVRSRELGAALDEVGVESVEEARSVLRRRVKLEAEQAQVRSRLEDLGGVRVQERVRRARESLAEARGALERLGGDSEDVDADRAASLLREAERSVEAREAREREASEGVDGLERELDVVRSELETLEAELIEDERALASARGKLELVVVEAGDARSRNARASELREERDAAVAGVQELGEQIQRLDPEGLAADADRVERALSQQDRIRREAHDRRTRAETLLTSDGSLDPYAELDAAEARLDVAREREGSARLRAESLALLHRTFKEERQAMARSLVGPLEERVNLYLGTVLGGSGELRLEMDGAGWDTPSLLRGERYAFPELSGGTKEQVAAAFRLAVAEVLAPDHGGHLPLIFDDAFAYSDPRRVEGLVRALDLASTRGIQVVLLTCTPQDYATLGAKLVRI
jgi:hypothetical protein